MVVVNITRKYIIFPFFILLFFLFFHCSKDKVREYRKLSQTGERTKQRIEDTIKLAKVIFFIENSASIFGYVNGYTNYVATILELAEKPDFVKDNVERVFYFINGGKDIVITPIGNTYEDLKNKLTVDNFRVGDISKSNLNKMFQIALKKAEGDTIVIFVSDGIYDLGKEVDPIKALAAESKETRTKFIERLDSSDLQTVIIKMYSDFKGNYFPVKGGIIKLHQKRPYYIWIFGKNKLLTKYFSNDYVASLPGYGNIIRFIKFENINVPYQVVGENSIGKFKIDRHNKNKLIDAEMDRHGLGFQFAFVCNFSDLPFTEEYFLDTSKYICNEKKYEIKSIEKLDRKIIGDFAFTPEYMFILYTNRIPYANLEIALKNILPEWISSTNIDREDKIKGDTIHTFGFKYLVEGISQAYKYFNKQDTILTFKFQIIK